MLNAIFAAIALFAQAAPVTPAPSAPTVSSVVVEGQKSAVLKDSEIVCHKEKVLGTMFPKEICAPRTEFAIRKQEDQKDLRIQQAYRPYDILKGPDVNQ